MIYDMVSEYLDTVSRLSEELPAVEQQAYGAAHLPVGALLAAPARPWAPAPFVLRREVPSGASNYPLPRSP